MEKSINKEKSARPKQPVKTITITEDNGSIGFESTVFSRIEIIGILTLLRDSNILDMLQSKSN